MPEDKPRYSRVSDIIDLAVFMQSKTNGISIKDIEKGTMYQEKQQLECEMA